MTTILRFVASDNELAETPVVAPPALTPPAVTPPGVAPPGVVHTTSWRPKFHYELIGCGLRGHELLG